jgi:prepilin peptidase CpaA
MIICITYIIFQILSGGYDLWTFKIPNILPLAIMILFFCAAAPNAAGVDWASHVGACVLIFVVGAVLFRFRLFGGGDVKLFSAAALWAGFPMLLPLVALTAIFGGLLVLVPKLLAPYVLAALSRLSFVSARVVPQVFAADREVPYGVAIAGAAIVLLPKLPSVLLSF